MARPIKNNADYFPHDADMRNDAKVKAVRRKFGLEGYAIYCMIIEYLSHSEHFKTKIDTLGLELMAGDFDIESAKLMEVIQYSISVELFQIDNLVLSCYSLEKRLNPLLSKRERDRIRVIAGENTESKGEESKVNKSKENIEENDGLLSQLGLEDSLLKITKDEVWLHNIQPLVRGKNLEAAGRAAFLYLESKPSRFKTSTIGDLKRTTLSWIENQKAGENGIVKVDQRERLKNL